jgi:hypothetical protein
MDADGPEVESAVADRAPGKLDRFRVQKIAERIRLATASEEVYRLTLDREGLLPPAA